jgi:biotin transport system substrate-specific component
MSPSHPADTTTARPGPGSAHPAAPAAGTSAPAPEGSVERASGSVGVRGLARIAVFAALIGALGLAGAIPVPGLVPITAQTLGVMLAGAILGPWRGAASAALLLAVAALGLPVLSGGRGGLGVFAGPSVGYLIGWVFGAFVVGLIVHGLVRRQDPAGRAGRGAVRPTWWSVALGAVVGGVLVIYAFGIPFQSAITGLGMGEAALASLAFLPGDLIKAAVCVLVTMALWRAYPRAFRG